MCEGHGHEHGKPLPRIDAKWLGAVREQGFRVVVTGKGGVGKTSLTALLARMLARDAFKVLALDADPQRNLAEALGVAPHDARAIVPLSRDPDFVEEKTGTRPGGWGGMLRLNPDVTDVVDRFGVTTPDGVRLLVMGTTERPASGCLCPENTLLAAVAGAVALRPGEAILLDTQAGVEHFGRALAQGFRHAIVVSDPTSAGVQVAVQGARLAQEMGIPLVHLVLNRVRDDRDEDRALRHLDAVGGFAFASTHVLPYDERMLDWEPDVGPLLDEALAPAALAARGVLDALLAHEERRLSCAS